MAMAQNHIDIEEQNVAVAAVAALEAWETEEAARHVRAQCRDVAGPFVRRCVGTATDRAWGAVQEAARLSAKAVQLQQKMAREVAQVEAAMELELHRAKQGARKPPFEWMQEGDVIGVGWVVKVNFNRGGKVIRNSHLYSGKVTHVNADGTYKVAYDDGDKEDSVQCEWVQWRRLVPAADQLKLANEGNAAFSEGQYIMGKCDEWQEHYAGTITKVNRDGTYGVTFEDGDSRPFMQASQLMLPDGSTSADRGANTGADTGANMGEAALGFAQGEAARELELHRAALGVQRIHRGSVARRRNDARLRRKRLKVIASQVASECIADTVRALSRTAAVRTIQRRYRGAKGRRRAGLARLDRLECLCRTHAARAIQRIARGRDARVRLHAERISLDAFTAAVAGLCHRSSPSWPAFVQQEAQQEMQQEVSSLHAWTGEVGGNEAEKDGEGDEDGDEDGDGDEWGSISNLKSSLSTEAVLAHERRIIGSVRCMQRVLRGVLGRRTAAFLRRRQRRLQNAGVLATHFGAGVGAGHGAGTSGKRVDDSLLDEASFDASLNDTISASVLGGLYDAMDDYTDVTTGDMAGNTMGAGAAEGKESDFSRYGGGERNTDGTTAASSNSNRGVVKREWRKLAAPTSPVLTHLPPLPFFGGELKGEGHGGGGGAWHDLPHSDGHSEWEEGDDVDDVDDNEEDDEDEAGFSDLE
jgi:hypothetical protein